MLFEDRTQGGRMLARRLKKYAGKDVVVYGVPRGGVMTAVEIARSISAPLDLVVARKISHPYNPEYAVAAIAENGHIAGEQKELASVDKDWLEAEAKKERREAVRRGKMYLHGKAMTSPSGKIAIIVDDGAATGLTLRVAIMEIKHYHPLKIVVAVPVVSQSTAEILAKEADELVALEIPSDDKFLGAVGSYYGNFEQVEDEEVIKILDEHNAWLRTGDLNEQL